MSSGNTLSKVVFTVRDTFINGYLAVRYVLKRSSPMGLQTGSITQQTRVALLDYVSPK